jgi:hypothetical protein
VVEIANMISPCEDIFQHGYSEISKSDGWGLGQWGLFRDRFAEMATSDTTAYSDNIARLMGYI